MSKTIEQAVHEALVNALIHRDYMEIGSEVHIDIFDDRLEIYSPSGMFDGTIVQDQDIDHIRYLYGQNQKLSAKKNHPFILTDIRRLINQAPYMNRQPAAVHIVSFLTQQIKKLRVDHGNQKIERCIRIRHDQKQGCFPVTDCIQCQLVIRRNLPKLVNIKRSQTSTAANKDGF